MGPKIMEGYTDLRKKEITEMAWQCFCEKGYRNTTMREIANRMGSTTGVIYGYFKSKDEILNALLSFSINQNEYIFKEISKKYKGYEAIKEAFSFAFETVPFDQQIRNNKGNIGLWMEAIQNEKVRKQLDLFYSDFQKYFVKFLSQTVKKGDSITTSDLKTMGGYYLALFMGLQVQSVLMGKKFTKTFIKKFLKILFNNMEKLN